ncbi:tetratricopeptide repeat protein [Bizionia sediminis]|uniref:Tetratricopeptide repeat protein n=1 Tax=Bizionia sediminis TaxID=1737064 RepID=A0ABW5KT92_9FLAO
MKQTIYFLCVFFGMLCVPQPNHAQIDYNNINKDDLGDAADLQQDYFFEALKQKAIENYDRAVTALLKCIELDATNHVFYYELGKNYNLLKNYQAAETALKTAVKMVPDNEWYLDELYEVYVQQDDLDKAIPVVKQLAKYHPDYKEDLATLYVKTKNYEKAIAVLDEMDAELGISSSRDFIRNQIYELTGQKQARIDNLENRVDVNPNKEANYLALIYRYSENNEKEKAFETAKKLLEMKPNSQLAHLALYKFYMDENNVKQAVASMKIVLSSSQIKPEAKMMVLSDFMNFVSENPSYESDLLEATMLVSNDEKGQSAQQVAAYHLKQGNKAKALQFYLQALKSNTDNYALIKNVLLLHIDLKNYTEAETLSTEALANYPSQPIFYLVNGVALNALNKPNKAVEALEMGLDYIIDDPKMQADFYKQLSVAHQLLNNTNKAQIYLDKAQKLEADLN